MSVVKIQIGQPGVADIIPGIVYIYTNDTYLTVASPGYLTSQNTQGIQFSNYQYAIVYTTDAGPARFNFQIRNGTVTLIPQALLSLGPIQFVNVPVTITEWLNMYSSPKLILDSPGGNSVILAMRATIYKSSGAALAAGGNVFLEHGTAFAGPAVTNFDPRTNYVGITAARSYFFTPNEDQFIFSFTPAVKNMSIYLRNATGPFTGGAGTTFNVHLWYGIAQLLF